MRDLSVKLECSVNESGDFVVSKGYSSITLNKDELRLLRQWGYEALIANPTARVLTVEAEGEETQTEPR
jgi:hypothetical protein